MSECFHTNTSRFAFKKWFNFFFYSLLKWDLIFSTFDLFSPSIGTSTMFSLGFATIGLSGFLGSKSTTSSSIEVDTPVGLPAFDSIRLQDFFFTFSSKERSYLSLASHCCPWTCLAPLGWEILWSSRTVRIPLAFPRALVDQEHCVFPPCPLLWIFPQRSRYWAMSLVWLVIELYPLLSWNLLLSHIWKRLPSRGLYPVTSFFWRRSIQGDWTRLQCRLKLCTGFCWRSWQWWRMHR